MKSNFKITGDDALIRTMQSLGADMEKALERGIVQTANQVRNTAIRSIQNQTFGTHVRRSSQGGGSTYAHIASKPGDAPNTDTGALVNSIAVEHTKGNPFAFVGSGLNYALWLEFGTKRSGKTYMQARPWLQPALDKNLKNFEANIVKQAKNMIRQKAKK
jgi:HK97 gp10 family phage protein